MTRSSEAPAPTRPKRGALEIAVYAGAALLSVFQLWQGITASIDATVLRPIFLTWVLVLVFLDGPGTKAASPAKRTLDVGLALLSLYCGSAVARFDYQSIVHLLEGLSPHDLTVGTLLLLLLLEATRRTVGPLMAMIAALFLLYNAFGNFLPDALANRGFTLERIVRFQIYTDSGVFGIPLGIAVGTVFVFVLFGAFLEVTGAGQFFIDLAFAVAGRFRGGPAKAAVVASAAMGSISGSAIANAVTTGTFTIPMMRRLGYRADQAAGIEAAASTGGQIMPPIMGAGAFIMAEFTNTPYHQIVMMSIAPALLYFFSTLVLVHLIAVRRSLGVMSERPRFDETLRQGYHFLFPLLIVTVLLFFDYSPPIVGTVGCVTVIVAGALSPRTRVGPALLFDGLKRGALMALPISTACATAGVVVGVIGQTGAGLQFTESVVEIASGQLWLALALITLAALVLGMGLPATAAYIVIAVMAAPALDDLGLTLLAAHMILFWLSQISNVTPPIALAAFAAAGIAGARPMKTAVEAVKLSAGLFLIPLMMAYSSLLLVEGVSVVDSAAATGLSVALILCFGCAVEGWGIPSISSRMRLALALAAVLIVYPNATGRTLGLVLAGATFTRFFLRARKTRFYGP